MELIHALIIVLCIIVIYNLSTKHVAMIVLGALIAGMVIIASSLLPHEKFGKYFGSSQLDTTDQSGGKEYEARWLDIDVDALREKILAVGGMLYHDAKLYRRYIYPLENGYARVRLEYDDTGSVVTLTTKTYVDKNFPVDHEVTVEDDFETACKFIESLNIKPKAYHETIREKYTGIDGCNAICIDTIPGLNPYVEIDCVGEHRLGEVAALLGLNMAVARYGPYANVFTDEYGIDAAWFNDELDVLTFDTVAEKLSIKVVKSKDKFDEIVAKKVM